MKQKEILARKDGFPDKTFTEFKWNLLPKHKNGWKEITDENGGEIIPIGGKIPPGLEEEKARRLKLQKEEEEKAAAIVANKTKAGEIGDDPEGAKADYDQLVVQAKEARDAGKKEEAIELFKKASQLNDNNWIKGQINKLETATE